MSDNQNTDPSQFAQSNYTDWARQLVEGLVEAERKWLELATQQNEITFKAIREGIEYYRSAPTPTLSEWARQGMENFMEAQRKWTESFNQQGTQFFNQQTQENPATENYNMATEAGRNMTGMAQQQVEMLADARRRWLDFAAQQNAQIVNGVKRALNIEEGSAGSTYVDWTQQAVNNYVEVQKRWLDLFTQLPFQRPNR